MARERYTPAARGTARSPAGQPVEAREGPSATPATPVTSTSSPATPVTSTSSPATPDREHDQEQTSSPATSFGQIAQMIARSMLLAVAGECMDTLGMSDKDTGEVLRNLADEIEGPAL